jgi:hypothetical protein
MIPSLLQSKDFLFIFPSTPLKSYLFGLFQFYGDTDQPSYCYLPMTQRGFEHILFAHSLHFLLLRFSPIHTHSHGYFLGQQIVTNTKEGRPGEKDCCIKRYPLFALSILEMLVTHGSYIFCVGL